MLWRPREATGPRSMRGWTPPPCLSTVVAVALLLLAPPARAMAPRFSFNAEGRKLFGGYRIAPQPCKSESDSRHGVCMFNYECQQRSGEVIAACMDSFLFGACCLMPPGSMIPSEALSKPAIPAIPAPSTVGVKNDIMSFVSTSTSTTTSKPSKPYTQRISVASSTTQKLPPIPAGKPAPTVRPTPPTFQPIRNTTPRPLATVISDESVNNAASISHILNLLDDSSVSEPIPQQIPGTTKRPEPSLSTWVSINGRPSGSSTTQKYPSNIHIGGPGPGFVVTNNEFRPALTPRPTPSAPAPTVIVLGPFGQDIPHTPDVISRPPGGPAVEPVVVDEEPVTQEFTTPTFEDAELGNKVHVFVDKIVNSLAGDFQNLEDVVLSNKNISLTAATTAAPTTVSTRKPSRTTTTKKPTTPQPPKRPSVAPITEAVVAETSSAPPVSYKKGECGVRPLVKNGRIVGGKGATFGEWPWQVLVRESTWLGLFVKNKCGGVLITQKYVITAAHCQPGFLASLVAVFGEFDLSGELESKSSVVKNVRRVIIHRSYEPATFENDIALLELESPVTFDKHIVPICLPEDNADFTGRMATVSGWGRLKYGGGVPSVLQEVQVPVIENNVCQEMFHTAGHAKSIISSFLCAGYANGQKDSCEGDSGGPLVVEKDGRWVLVGTVSHGIKCAAPYLPGVYMRTTYYKPWLKTITGAS